MKLSEEEQIRQGVDEMKQAMADPDPTEAQIIQEREARLWEVEKEANLAPEDKISEKIDALELAAEGAVNEDEPVIQLDAEGRLVIFQNHLIRAHAARFDPDDFNEGQWWCCAMIALLDQVGELMDTHHGEKTGDRVRFFNVGE